MKVKSSCLLPVETDMCRAGVSMSEHSDSRCWMDSASSIIFSCALSRSGCSSYIASSIPQCFLQSVHVPGSSWCAPCSGRGNAGTYSSPPTPCSPLTHPVFAASETSLPSSEHHSDCSCTAVTAYLTQYWYTGYSLEISSCRRVVTLPLFQADPAEVVAAILAAHVIATLCLLNGCSIMAVGN